MDIVIIAVNTLHVGTASAQTRDELITRYHMLLRRENIIAP